MISDEKVANLDPINASNGYWLLKIKDTHHPEQHIAMVESRILNGGTLAKMEQPWMASTG